MFTIHSITNPAHNANRAGLYWGVFNPEGDLVAAFHMYVLARKFVESCRA